jgi:hypothetical protein
MVRRSEWAGESLGQLADILPGWPEGWPWDVREVVPAYLFQSGPRVTPRTPSVTTSVRHHTCHHLEENKRATPEQEKLRGYGLRSLYVPDCHPHDHYQQSCKSEGEGDGKHRNRSTSQRPYEWGARAEEPCSYQRVQRDEQQRIRAGYLHLILDPLQFHRGTVHQD